MSRRYDEGDYQRLAERHGYEWISDELPPSLLDPTTWRCGHGHEFLMRGANVMMGRRCPYCSGRWRRRERDYRELAARGGLEWIGRRLPPNTREKTEWRRKEDGLVFSATYRAVSDHQSSLRRAGMAREQPDAAAPQEG